MTTGLTYSTYVSTLAQLAVVDPADTNYLAILPQCITYAENRIYRDVDFLQTVKAISSYTLTTNNRNLTVQNTDFITIQEVNVITPAATSNPELGTRNPLIPVTKEFLNFAWPSSTGATVPKYFAMLGNTELDIILGPWPDATYHVEIVGTYRPDSLSNSTTTTFISTYLPDLFLMASMIFISGFQRNFSSSGNDPQMPINYEQQYKALLQGAVIEEARKKFQSSGWTPESPPSVASPTRG